MNLYFIIRFPRANIDSQSTEITLPEDKPQMSYKYDSDIQLSLCGTHILCLFL